MKLREKPCRKRLYDDDGDGHDDHDDEDVASVATPDHHDTIVPQRRKQQQKRKPKRSNQTQRRQHSQKKKQMVMDSLRDIPDQEPILRSEFYHQMTADGGRSLLFQDHTRPHPVKYNISSSTSSGSGSTVQQEQELPPRSSRYLGVHLDLVVYKWRAQMMLDGTVVNLGCYTTEEEAGRVYAKAAYRYKPPAPERGIYAGLDLRNVPQQPLILRSDDCRNGRGRPTTTTTILYKGVKKCRNRWQARLSHQGKILTLGTFDTMEEAAQVYANALYVLQSTPSRLDTTATPTTAVMMMMTVVTPVVVT
jgi:hypothetical protein